MPTIKIPFPTRAKEKEEMKYCEYCDEEISPDYENVGCNGYTLCEECDNIYHDNTGYCSLSCCMTGECDKSC